MTPLRQRMSEDMQVRNLASHTQRSYLQQVSQFARHFSKSPELLGPDDIRACQLHLTRDRHFSASSILVAVAAIRFLYKGWVEDTNENRSQDDLAKKNQAKTAGQYLKPSAKEARR